MSLATNWRTSKNRYICNRSGNDADTGATKGNPWKTIGVHLGGGVNIDRSYLIRSGYYFESSGFPSGTSEDSLMYADGFVVIDGAGSTAPFYAGSGAENDDLLLSGRDAGKNIGIFLLQNIDTISHSTLGQAGRQTRFTRCIFKSCNLIYCTGSSSFLLFLNCTTIVFSNTALIQRATFINSTLSIFEASIRNCFFDKSCNILNASPTGSEFVNCAFEANTSQFQISGNNIKDITLDADANTIGNTYVPNEKFSGTVTISNDVYTFANCFYTDDPKFNNESTGDYTLKADSPLVNQLNIIGWFGTAIPFDSNHPAFDPANSGVSYVDVDRNTVDGSFDLIAPNAEGTVTSTDDPSLCITLPFETVISELVQFFGTFLYNQGEWIDKENYSVGVNDEVRLTIEFQIYDENEPNGANSPLNFSDWIEFENQLQLEVDAAGLGNGNVSANLENLGAITAKRFRVRFTIRTNGV